MSNVNSESKSSAYFFLCLASPFLAAAGIWFPIVKTSTGYTYSIVNNPSLFIYGACIFVLIANIVADRVDFVVAKRLTMLSIVVLGGSLVYASGMYKDGVDWIYSQSLYDATGMHWTINGVDYDWNKITSMTVVEKAQSLSSKGVAFSIYPFGLLMIIGAIAIQVYFASACVMNSDKNSDSKENQSANEKNIVRVLAGAAIGLAVFTGPSLSGHTFGVSGTLAMPKAADEPSSHTQNNAQAVTKSAEQKQLVEQVVQQKDKLPTRKKAVSNEQDKSASNEGDLSLDKYRNLVGGVK